MKNNEVQLRRWFLFAVAAVGILPVSYTHLTLPTIA